MQEYRLVPVDEWDEEIEKRPSERKVDVKALADTVWGQRNFIFKVTGICVIIGILIALLSPIGYKVQATLLPEKQTGAGFDSGLIDQFGGLLGLGSGRLNLQSDNIPPELYPKIVNSTPYQLDLLNAKMAFARYDTTVTVYTFFDEIYTPSVLSYLKGYTLGLPGKIKNLFTEEQPPVPLPHSMPTDSIISLTKHQAIIVNVMRKHVTAEVNEENGLVSLTATMPDPNAAAEIGQLAIRLLKKYVTNYRTSKAEQYLQFVEEQTALAKKEFRDIQDRLAAFRDSHINLLTARAQTEEQRLQSEYNLHFNKYNSLAQQLQQAKLKVQQKTPVVTVLQPIKMPVDNYTPQRKLIVIIALFVGLILSIGYIISRSVMNESNSR